jgi:hypothetical protein
MAKTNVTDLGMGTAARGACLWARSSRILHQDLHSCSFVVNRMEAWLKKLGIGAVNPGVFDGTWRCGPAVESVSPIDGEVIARVG